MNNRHSYAMHGNKVSSLQEACNAVPFHVEVEPAARFSTGKAIKNTKALFRSDTGTCLGIHSERFAFVQPCDSLATLEEARKIAGGEWQSAAAIKGGRKLVAFLSLSQYDFSVKVGDVVNVSIMYIDSFDGSGRMMLKLLLNRLRCMNGATSAESLYECVSKHCLSITDRFQMMRGSLQMNLALQVEEMRQTCSRLADSPFTRSEMEKFAEVLFPTPKGREPSTQMLTAREELVTGFLRGTGNEGLSKWDAFNAVTERLDWQATYRETEFSRAENRLESLTMGQAANLRRQALAYLLA